MPASPLPVHIPTNAETGAHLVTNIAQDGTVTAIDATTGQKVTMRIAVDQVGGQLTIVAVGPGSSG
jgi:hypothetical protein